MKKIIGIVGCIALVFMLGTNAAASGRGAGVVKSAGRLQVIGNQVRGDKIPNQTLSLAGMSFFWSNWSGSYYNAETVNYLVDNFQVSLVRAAYGAHIEQGYDGDWTRIEAVVDAAIARDIYVIIDWHTEGDAWKYEAHANDFFDHFSKKYGNYPHVIYEVWNEPISSGVDSLKRWCNQMAGIIRANDPDNLIICGSDTWSQYPQSYTISDPNVAYTFHGYFDDPEHGSGHVSQFYNNVDAAMRQGSAVFVTEFGANYGTTGGTSQIMDACIERGISMAAWSVFDKREPWSIFEKGSGISRLTDIGRFYQLRMATWPEIASDDDDPVIEIPGKMEAEDYSDSFGIKTQPTTDDGGGSNVGWIENSDWASYTVNVAKKGLYNIHFRVASDTEGGKIALQSSGETVADIQVVNTGGWQSWETVSVEANLNRGEQTFKLLFQGSGAEGLLNLNHVVFEYVEGDGDVFELPGKIEAEDYSDSYGIDTEPATDEGGGLNIGWIENNDWASYSVNVTKQGMYNINFRVASDTEGGQISLQSNGETLTDIEVTNTGGWQSWETVSTEAYLEEGEQTIKLLFHSGGTEDMLNLNHLIFDYVGSERFEIPGKIEAEKYTDSYGIDTQETTDEGGGLNIGWIENNDWASYAVNVTEKGMYNISFRVASDTRGGSITLLSNGETSGVIEVTNTGGWQSWKTISTAVALDEGEQTIKLQFTGGSEGMLNLNYMVFDYIGNDNHVIPGKMEAEDFSDSFGIDTEQTMDDGGGTNIGWIENDDWASYNVYVAEKGMYKINFRVASNTDGGRISIYNEGDFLTDVTVTHTGGWQSWQTISADAYLNAGVQTLKLQFNGGSYDLLNLNWVSFQHTDTPDPSWNLVWSDEFNYSGSPDPGKWGYETGGGGWGNKEDQYYTERSENARVENGHLIIEARKEYYGGRNYTSARLFSRGEGDWLYGKVEVRAKLPWGRGTWPAIWMLPTDWEYGNWPRSGEIDIMEHVGYDQGNIVGTVHTDAYNHTKNTQKGNSIRNESASDAFHTYSMEWYPERIDIFMDGTKYFTFDNEHASFAEWPFDKRFHLMLNIAIGGNWGGVQGIDDSIFPQKMEVDYVRVYQKP